MDKYKKVIRKTGVINYYKNGKYIKSDEIDILPKEVIDMPEGELNIKINKPKKEKQPEGHVSIISGRPATKQRMYNGVSYYMTDEEYIGYSLGELARFILDKQDSCEEAQELPE